MKRIEKLYKPSEMETIQKELKLIYDNWFGSIEKPATNFVNATIVGLHKAGYKIIKVD